MTWWQALAHYKANRLAKPVKRWPIPLALALQDANDSQRNFDAINGGALAKATEEFVKSKDSAWLPVIEGLQKAKMTQDAEFLKISQGVEGLLKNLPLPS